MYTAGLGKGLPRKGPSVGLNSLGPCWGAEATMLQTPKIDRCLVWERRALLALPRLLDYLQGEGLLRGWRWQFKS